MARGRMTLGLYNTYDPRRFAEAHRRALSRAGPIALAFHGNLATFGFPYPPELKTPTAVARWAGERTSIGEHGAYLVDLANQGRFMTFELPRAGFPPQLGEVIVTTSAPAGGRAVTPPEAAARLRRGESFLVLFGLGPHGLPRDVVALGRYHLDITGRGLSLETCTALGAVAGILGTLATRAP